MAHAQLQGFPVVIELDVGWSDMDSFDHVSNLVYFRYFQDARLTYLERTGWLQLKRETGQGPILKSTSATYRKPLKFPDRVWVGVRASEVKEDRVSFEHRVVSRTTHALVCEGVAVVVSYDYRAEMKCGLPESVRKAISGIEAQPR